MIDIEFLLIIRMRTYDCMMYNEHTSIQSIVVVLSKGKFQRD